MSCFVFCCWLFVCKLKLYLINYFGLGRESLFFSCSLLVIMWFQFRGVSASSWCSGLADLFYCGNFWPFHIIDLFAITAVGFVLGGASKKSFRTSTIVQFVFYLFILRNQK